MKKRNHFPDHQNLLTGELYLFHPADHTCPAIGSLFGIFDKSDSSIIYLESSSWDFIHFRLWHRLPDDYCCCRRASRRELRDYIFNLASFERHEKCSTASIGRYMLLRTWHEILPPFIKIPSRGIVTQLVAAGLRSWSYGAMLSLSASEPVLAPPAEADFSREKGRNRKRRRCVTIQTDYRP